MAAIVLVVVTGAACYELYTSRKAVIADTERQLARLDRVFAEQTGRAIEAVDQLVTGAVEAVQTEQSQTQQFQTQQSQTRQSQTRQRPAPALAEMLERRIKGVGQLAAIFAYETSGKMIVSTDTTMASAPPPAMLAGVLARYREDPRAGLTISPPFRVADNKWNALLVRPTWAPDGTLTGVAAGSIDLSYFEDFYRAVELNENGAITLHLRDGTILARFPHNDHVIGTSFGDLPPFTTVLVHAQAGTLLMQSPIDNSTRVIAVRALRGLPLAVMISIDERKILGDWQRKSVALIVVALLLGGAVVILLLSLSRRSRQVERLLDETHAARDIAEQAKDRLLEQIAERARAEGALRQAQRIDAIGQLTGGVAHDFNNLLMVVLGNVDILQRRPELQRIDRLAERLSAIRIAAERGATLTGHLLAFARRQPLMPKAIDLNATILGMQNLLDSALGARAHMQFRLASDLWPAMADQSQIELVILNLVLNSRDAMPDGGLITIETVNHRRTETVATDGPPPGDYVTITVKDTGTGIAPDVLPRVFEPFFTTKPPGAGSGLGLSQVFGTAKQSGGEVHITSEVGRGTAVTVDLPRAAVGPLCSAGQRDGAKLQGSDATILLVDDDDPVRAVTAAMLQDLGYTVWDGATGEAALAELAREGADILLTDVVMPGMNGLQLSTAARAAQPGLSVVFMSGYGDQIGGTLDAGDTLVQKPFSAAQLHRAIEAKLTERRGVPSKA